MSLHFLPFHTPVSLDTPLGVYGSWQSLGRGEVSQELILEGPVC